MRLPFPQATKKGECSLEQPSYIPLERPSFTPHAPLLVPEPELSCYKPATSYPVSHSTQVGPAGPEGPPGPAGPPGPPGAAAATYVHTQSVSANIWTVNHNLGFKPAVELYTVGGLEFDAEIVHVSDNQCLVYIAISIAGFARCN